MQSQLLNIPVVNYQLLLEHLGTRAPNIKNIEFYQDLCQKYKITSKKHELILRADYLNSCLITKSWKDKNVCGQDEKKWILWIFTNTLDKVFFICSAGFIIYCLSYSSIGNVIYEAFLITPDIKTHGTGLSSLPFTMWVLYQSTIWEWKLLNMIVQPTQAHW